jgi:hypothetical protein
VGRVLLLPALATLARVVLSTARLIQRYCPMLA